MAGWTFITNHGAVLIFSANHGKVRVIDIALELGITERSVHRIITDLADKAKLGNLLNPETGQIHHVSPHRLRDAFAIHAVKVDDSGDGLKLLQEHLGHQSITTTMKYRKIAGEEHKAWFKKLRA